MAMIHGAVFGPEVDKQVEGTDHGRTVYGASLSQPSLAHFSFASSRHAKPLTLHPDPQRAPVGRMSFRTRLHVPWKMPKHSRWFGAWKTT